MNRRLDDEKYRCGTFEWRSLQLTKINNGVLWWSPSSYRLPQAKSSVREREREKKCLFIFVLHSHADYKKLETVHSCPRGISSVFFPPCHLSSSAHWKCSKEGMLVEDVRSIHSTIIEFWWPLFHFFLLTASERNINSPTPYYIQRFVILVLCVQTPNTPPVACAVLMALRGPLLHWCLMELIVPYQFSHHFPWNWTLVPMYHPAAPFLGSDWSMERKP